MQWNQTSDAVRDRKISSSRAAGFSAEVTEDVAEKMDYELPPGIFCSRFIERVRAAFPSKYPKLGATVSQ